MAAVLVSGSRAARLCWHGVPGVFNGCGAWRTADGAKYFACQKSSNSVLPDDYNCNVELAMTSDGKTIVCYHPSVNIPYEHTKPLPLQDPVDNLEDTHEHMLKARLNDIENKPGPTIEELSKMFYTTKHRWYPIGLYHQKRMKKNPPKDR